MREQLIEHLRGAVRPLVERLVEQVVGMVATHTAASWDAATAGALEQLRAALRVGPPAAAPAPRPRKTKRRKARRVAAAKMRPAKVVQRARKAAKTQATPVDQKRPAARDVVHRDVKSDNVPKPAKPSGVHGCGTCGQIGHNARTCRREIAATTPNVYASAKAKVDRAPVSIAVPPPPVRAVKPSAAAIEQHRSRIAVLRERSAQQHVADRPIATAGEDDNPNAREHWTAQEIADETAAATRSKRPGTMPRARAMFEVDCGGVVELDFGGGE